MVRTPQSERTTVSSNSYGVEINNGLRSLVSKLSDNYIFDSDAGTVEVVDSDFKKCLYIVNQTHGKTIFNPWVPDMRGEQEGDIVLLNYDTSQMSDSDTLLIQYYPDQSSSQRTDNHLILRAIDRLIVEQKITNKYLEMMVDEHLCEDDLE